MKRLGIRTISGVIIVPLWNWNKIQRVAYRDGSCYNCTFMELKLFWFATYKTFTNVIIVPLWNWNKGGVGKSTLTTLVIIVPLWNWNVVRRKTFYHRTGVIIVPLWNWNQYGHTCVKTIAKIRFLTLHTLNPNLNWTCQKKPL